MSTTHVLPTGGFTAGDGVDNTVLRPRDWKDDHLGPAYLIFALQFGTWNVPATKTELGGLTAHRLKYSFQYVTQFRFVVNIKAAGKGTLAVEYSTNLTTWNSLDGLGGPSVSLIRYGTIDSGWLKTGVTLAGLGATDVTLRIVGSGGSATNSIQFGLIQLFAK